MSNPFSNKRLAVLGTGKMGSILLRSFLEKKMISPGHVAATVRHAERAAPLAEKLGVRVSTDNRAAADGADVILLAVKPPVVVEVLEEIRGEVTPKTLVVSVAASVPTKLIEQHLGENVPCGAGDAQHAVRDRGRHDRSVEREPCGRSSRGTGESDVRGGWPRGGSGRKTTWTRSPGFRRAGRLLPTSSWSRWRRAE